MFFLLIFLALLSGAISFAVLLPYGLVFSLVSAPIIASLMTFIGAVLIKPAAYQGSARETDARAEVEARVEVKIND